MKKLLLIAAIFLASTSAFAQHEPGSLTIQPRIGFSGADFNNTDDTKARVGLIVGPEFEYYLSNKFSLAAGINYSQQGSEFESPINVLNLMDDITFKNDYITVPIVANVYLFKGFALKAGIQPGYNISSKYSAKINGSEKSVDSEDVKSFDFSIPVGLSYEFMNFVLDARYTFGLTKVFEDSYNLDSKNLTFQVTLGYKFTLF